MEDTMNKIKINLLIIIQTISLLISSILAIIFYNCFNFSFYENFYKKENLADNIGTTYPELINNTHNLLDYLKGDAALNTTWYSTKDILHMVDVKKLYGISYYIMVSGYIIFVFLTILLLFLLKWKFLNYLTAIFNKVSISFVLAVAILGIVISVNFNTFWLKFHTILFSNDLWLLSPDESNLIKMVPEEFFTALVTKIVVHVLIFFVCLIVANSVFKKYFSKTR
ncbi:TIGR01906 family protein [Gemella bergeri ATCC 700627]|uniref:TIGR01906 family protein n=2 Tax=Gemella bergeri TaxID=84136 RepID=U2Q2E5_9BACL|nr:TIGR01906 family protein [Gemella bergeri ATCC 700627]